MNKDGGWLVGHMRVFRYSGDNSKWIQLGEDTDGEGNRDYFGSNVALSNDGKSLASVAPTFKAYDYHFDHLGNDHVYEIKECKDREV